MRFIIDNPEVGDKRVKTKFLWFPKKIGTEIRWLETATWVEVFVYQNGQVFWVSQYWEGENNE